MSAFNPVCSVYGAYSWVSDIYLNTWHLGGSQLLWEDVWKIESIKFLMENSHQTASKILEKLTLSLARFQEKTLAEDDSSIPRPGTILQPLSLAVLSSLVISGL